MKLEVQVISEERVRPSAPTPSELSCYELSFLDQLAPPVYMPMVLFFPKEPECSLTRGDRVDQLKKSLSEALTLYYPLAGVLNEPKLCVDCDGVNGGAYFVEALANCELSSVLNDPNPNDMNDFLAVELDDERVAEIPVAIQVTLFTCDGMAVSLCLCLNHRVVDALTFFMFLNAWSAISRGKSDVKAPQFGAATLFPAKELSGFRSNSGIIKDDIVTKRFIFDATKITELRVRYEDKMSVSDTRRPTRVEALSSFIWHRLMVATEPKDGAEDNRICTVLHAVNLRPRVDPPLPENYFGNISRIAISEPSTEPENGSYTIVSHVRGSIKKIDAEFVKRLRDEDGHLSFLKRRLAQVTRGELVSFSFTSLCRFPIYDADFGWGKPAFVGSARLTYKNLVSFFDTKSGDGIEAWVNLRSQDMVKFETDEEILAFVSHKTPKG